MSGVSRAGLAGTVALAGLLAAAVAPAETPEKTGRVVRLEGGRLTVALERAPAGEVFQAIAGLGTFVVRFDRSLLKVPLTATFEAVPIEQGLRRLIAQLQTENYRMEFGSGPDGLPRIERVEILAASGPRVVQEFGAAAAGAAVRDVPAVESPKPMPKGLARKLQRGLNPGQERKLAEGRLDPEKVRVRVPEGQRLKAERGEPLSAHSAWKLEQARRQQEAQGGQ